MKNKRIIVYGIAILVILGIIFGYQYAYAATDNTAVTVPYVQAGEDQQTMGTLKIREDDSQFRDGDYITVKLPRGVEYTTRPTEGNISQYIGGTATFIASSDNSITVEVYGTDENDVIYFYYGENEEGSSLGSTVNIDNDYRYENIKVTIDAAGTTITSKDVRVARVTEGNTITTIDDIEAVAFDSISEIETIKIEEAVPGIIIPNGDDIVFELPNDFEWVLDQKTVSAIGGLAVTSITVDIDDPKKLLISVGGTATAGQAGFIAISGLQIMVPDDADEGDVEMNVDGNEVNEEDIIIATVGDFGFEADVDGDVPVLIGGKTDQEIANFYIDDLVPETWIEGRSVKLTLPDWAEWNDINADVDVLTKGKVNTDDTEILKYIVSNGNGKVEFEEFTVNIDADAPAGDLTVVISGSAGVDVELVIGTVVAPFDVTGGNSILLTGKQNQGFGNIVITESVDGALEDGSFVVLEFPSGVTLEDIPTIEVTAGNLEIGDIDLDGQYLSFAIDSDSSKVSTITISDLVFTVNNVAVEGDFEVKVSILANEDIDIEDGEEVTTAILGQITNKLAPGMGSVVQFTIGQYSYVKDGITIPMDVAPYISNSRTYLPLRYVANAYGITDNNIIWNDIDKTVVLMKDGRVIQFKIGSKIMIINGVPFTMDVAPEIVDPGRTTLPMRFVAQALGLTVTWDETTRTVIVK